MCRIPHSWGNSIPLIITVYNSPSHLGGLYTVIVNGIQFPQVAFGEIKHNSHLGELYTVIGNGIQFPQSVGGIVYRYRQRYTIPPVTWGDCIPL